MQPTFFDMGSNFTNRSTKSVTFQGKLDLPIHRWYRLTPSFSPQLANDIADHFGLTTTDFVLDPFSGVGTVPLCMKYRGIPACSVELNPYLHFVGTVKTRTYHDIPATESCFEEFISDYRASLEDVPFQSKPAAYLKDYAADIPRINFPQRWWSPGNLAQLVCLRKLVTRFQAAAHILDLLKMAVLGILVPVSNAKHNHVSLTFAKEPLPTVAVAEVLEQQLRNMAADLKAVSELPAADVTIYRGNSKELTKVLPNRVKVSAVITSPPYPNRFSYARETRPHLFFFDFITSASAVGQLETDAIGGTWGKATSVLAHGITPKNELIQKLLDPHLRGIHTNGNLMANYVVKYFNNMYDHAAQVAEVCRKQARLAYVIGNSKFYENPLPSDEILAAIYGHFGFELERIDRMRKRQSKRGLYEAVVFMSRDSV
jgi:tRNA G10  N-methylase Trm11